MEGLTFEGVSFNVEHVQSFKSAKDFVKDVTVHSIFNEFSKEDKEEIQKKVYDECQALKKK